MTSATCTRNYCGHDVTGHDRNGTTTCRECPCPVAIDENGATVTCGTRPEVGTLFDTGPEVAPRQAPFASGSRTSYEASKNLDLRETDERVLTSIRNAGPTGRTCDEVEVLLAMLHQTASSSINRLKKYRLIVETNSVRLTRSKRPAAVYMATRKEHAAR